MAKTTVRQRRNPNASNDKNSSSSNGSVSTKGPNVNSFNLFSYWKQIIGCVVLGIAVVFGYLGYLETRVNTPYDDKKCVIASGLDVPEQFWGSYRPGAYFGLKTRDPQSLVTGLMWYFPKRLRPGGDGIRHWCEQSDNLEKYGWLQHDGTNFGVQEIIDGPFVLKTSFVKRLGGLNGGDFTARISVAVKNNKIREGLGEDASFVWYAALDENTKGFISPTNSASKLTGIRGETSGLGEFTIKIYNQSGIIDNESYLSTVAPGLHLLKETVITSLRLAQDSPKSPKKVILGGELFSSDNKNVLPNFVAVQITGKVPFTIDVVFESGSFGTRPNHLLGETYTQALAYEKSRFDQRFEKTFHLKEKGYDKKNISFAQHVLSNMVGGIGYFYGSSKVQSSYTKEPVHYWNAPLFTAVPSRSFFPRGFLWDEGFHGFLISAWDIDLELDIISHWFDLMNVEGWIPREQILGVEALAKVPSEFVVQRNTNANPPTFFLTLQYIIRHFGSELTEKRLEVLERLYPRLQAWFQWFNTTQKGTAPGSYRWRGRDALTNRELNPKTLTSGLDDFPRASHPTSDERHIDLYCWITIASDTMAKIARLLDRDSFKYEQTYEFLRNSELLNELHWSDFAKTYSDYGFHTDSVVLRRPKALPRSENQNLEMIRVVLKNPEYRYVDSNVGYVSLFPFILQILDSNNDKIPHILNIIKNPNTLWSPFGLRSLSSSSPLYMQRNTEHDPPYWRGQIWININYLTLRALYFYKNQDGPYKSQCNDIYQKLRTNVVSNVINQYYKTGYVWEQYNDKTGAGSGCRPFTGWSGLVVSIMSENY